MSKENIEILKKLREDLYNYSIEYNKIDYLKARYALEEELEFANNLQSNWNSLREWLENLIDNFQEDVSTPILHEQMTIRLVYEYMEYLDKMNELEGVDNENNNV